MGPKGIVIHAETAIKAIDSAQKTIDVERPYKRCEVDALMRYLFLDKFTNSYAASR